MDARERLQQTVADNPAPLMIDTGLEVRAYTHKSFYPHSIRTEEPKDWGRLAFIGAELIAMCATEVLLQRYKTMRPTHLSRLRNMVANIDTVAEWSELYEFPDRIRASPSQQSQIQSQTKHRAAVFEAYVGAVYHSEDLSRVQNWLRPLILCVLEAYDERGNGEDSDDDSDDDEFDTGDRGIEVTDTTPTRNSPSRTPGLETFVYDMRQPSFSDDSASIQSSGSTSISRMSLLRQPTSASTRATHGVATGGAYANAPSAHRLLGLSDSSELPSQRAAPIRPPHGVTTADVHANPPGVHRFPTISQLSDLPSVPSGLKFHPHGSPSVSNLTPRSNPLLTPVSMTQTPRRPSLNYAPATSPPPGGYLALFNQLASQKHIEPEWLATATGKSFTVSDVVHSADQGSKGPAHRPTFKATVKINGTICGEGVASSKQTAKHHAAKDALDNLRWHTK
ncbi:hypothetical protein PIIN_02408 [Serendipita indica DSM 11827]|uniref:DRBM domain-containing protein n=1 Tax=Serendipita indica (strain DSM 11827) TaxID=1109443 RepID=G4TB69_SERID|nr:hypothetical protein PIIN_02408 [Serendipita indica DSM 11827]